MKQEVGILCEYLRGHFPSFSSFGVHLQHVMLSQFDPKSHLPIPGQGGGIFCHFENKILIISINVFSLNYQLSVFLIQYQPTVATRAGRCDVTVLHPKILVFYYISKKQEDWNC